MGNDVSKVINTASHVQSVVNSVVNPGVANIVGTVAVNEAGADTKAIGQTVSSVTYVDLAAQVAKDAARNTAFLLKKQNDEIQKLLHYRTVALPAPPKRMPKARPWENSEWMMAQSGGGSVDVTNAMPLPSNSSAGTTGSLAFSARLMRNIQRPEVLASSVAGAVAGVLGGDNGAMRLFLGVAGAAVPPIAYTALTGACSSRAHGGPIPKSSDVFFAYYTKCIFRLFFWQP
jgi:hypothetical protein